MAPIKKSDGDWLASLARQSTSVDTKTKKPNNTTSKRKRKGNNNNGSNDSDDINNSQGDNVALTKSQRIERREQKKNQREERKRLTEEVRQQRLVKNLAKKRQRSMKGSDSVAAKARIAAKGTPSSANTNQHEQEKSGKHGMTTLSQRALTQLSTDLNSTVSHNAQQTIASAPKQTKRQKKKKQESDVPDEPAPAPLSNGLPIEPKGKATKHSTLRPESKELQPRIRDYNGQGLVRSSLYLPFNDPSFCPKLELEFEEHVPGFFGKSKTKAAKKQAGKNMLWRRCLTAKEEEGGGSGSGGGKSGSRKRKKKEVGLDTRVEGMMRQGVM